MEQFTSTFKNIDGRKNILTAILFDEDNCILDVMQPADGMGVDSFFDYVADTYPDIRVEYRYCEED